MSVEVEVTYSSAEVCRLAGITYRQLDYWCRIGLLRPDWRQWGVGRHGDLQLRDTDYEGSGQRRVFGPAELVKAQAMAQMLADGVSFQHARRLVQRGQWLVCAVLPLPQAPEVEVGVAGVAAAGEVGAGRGTPAAPAGTPAATPPPPSEGGRAS